MHNSLSKKTIKSWDEVIAIVTTKISAALMYYKAILHNIIPFEPYNFDDFVSPCYKIKKLQLRWIM